PIRSQTAKRGLNPATWSLQASTLPDLAERAAGPFPSRRSMERHRLSQTNGQLHRKDNDDSRGQLLFPHCDFARPATIRIRLLKVERANLRGEHCDED